MTDKSISFEYLLRVLSFFCVGIRNSKFDSTILIPAGLSSAEPTQALMHFYLFIYFLLLLYCPVYGSGD